MCTQTASTSKGGGVAPGNHPAGLDRDIDSEIRMTASVYSSLYNSSGGEGREILGQVEVDLHASTAPEAGEESGALGTAFRAYDELEAYRESARAVRRDVVRAREDVRAQRRAEGMSVWEEDAVSAGEDEARSIALADDEMGEGAGRGGGGAREAAGEVKAGGGFGGDGEDEMVSCQRAGDQTSTRTPSRPPRRRGDSRIAREEPEACASAAEAAAGGWDEEREMRVRERGRRADFFATHMQSSV